MQAAIIGLWRRQRRRTTLPGGVPAGLRPGEGRAAGRQMLYRLTPPELLTVLAAAAELLAATGNAVALCPVYGTGQAQEAGA